MNDGGACRRGPKPKKGESVPNFGQPNKQDLKLFMAEVYNLEMFPCECEYQFLQLFGF